MGEKPLGWPPTFKPNEFFGLPPAEMPLGMLVNRFIFDKLRTRIQQANAYPELDQVLKVAIALKKRAAELNCGFALDQLAKGVFPQISERARCIAQETAAYERWDEWTRAHIRKNLARIQTQASAAMRRQKLSR